MLDERKIVFITCVNDEVEYAECRYYLERLQVPDGYTAEIMSIREAPSMTAGYHAAMKDSDAKYKVYLHQDVFIINSHFIEDMLTIFARNEKIGMLGVIGKKEIGYTLWDMLKGLDTGKVIYNHMIMSRSQSEKEGYAEVMMADGLLLATQYDIPWREDILDGWDFYDVSQCLEFHKAGYKVVIPYQEEVWCCHDGVCLEMIHFFEQYKKFRQEYAPILGIPSKMEQKEQLFCEKNQYYMQKRRALKESIAALLAVGERDGVRTIFQDPELERDQYLMEYRDIAHIDQMEEQTKEPLRFWQDGMTVPQLLLKLHILKFALKRIEYGVDGAGTTGILKEYSRYAIKEVCSRYVAYQERVLQRVGNWSEDEGE